MSPPGLLSWTLRRDGVALHAQAMGDGPAVVLLHGFSSSFRRNWHGTGWTRALALSGRRALGLDFRGHGRSARSEDPAFYFPEVLCADIAALQDAADAAPCDVAGFSMGAAIALQFAILHPDRVRRLVLGGVGDKILPSDPPPPEPALIADALAAPDPDQIRHAVGRRFRTFAERGGNDLGALAAMMRGPGWPGRVDHLGPVPCPTLVVLAENDDFMPRTERLRALLPDARFVTVPGTDHIGLSQDARFRDLALDFFAAD